MKPIEIPNFKLEADINIANASLPQENISTKALDADIKKNSKEVESLNKVQKKAWNENADLIEKQTRDLGQIAAKLNAINEKIKKLTIAQKILKEGVAPSEGIEIPAAPKQP